MFGLRGRCGGLAGVAVVPLSMLVGCLSPTLPMPPPGEPTEYEIGVDRQTLTVRGRVASPDSWVVLLNSTLESEDAGGREIGKLVAPDQDGYYEASLAADLVTYQRNRLKLWQQLQGGEVANVREFSVPPDCVFWFDAGVQVSLGVRHAYQCTDRDELPSDASASQ